MGDLHGYRVRSRPGTDVGIFVPEHIPTRYKCDVTFVPGRLEEAPTCPCE
jgi:hypothetical protein